MRISMISFGSVESKSNGYFIRCFHIAKCLSNLKHTVLVMEFPEEKSPNLITSQEGILFLNLKGNVINPNRVSRKLIRISTVDPFHVIKFQLYSLVELFHFRDYLNCDIIFVEGALIPFGLILSKILRKKVILDTHCINKLLALRFKDRNRLIYFARKTSWDFLERLATRICNVVIVVSIEEKEFVERDYTISRSKIFVVPNIVEIPRRHPKKEWIKLVKKWKLENKIVLTFVGDLNSIQNKDAVEYIVNDLAPFFWKKRKDAIFLIIGKGQENFQHKLSNVIFTDFVNDLTPYLEMSDICIAPLRVGAGVKTKILTYIVHGKPVVTTPRGIEGVNVDKLNSTVVTDITQFADTLLKTLGNLPSLNMNARKNSLIAKNKFSTDTVEQQLKEVLDYATET